MNVVEVRDVAPPCIPRSCSSFLKLLRRSNALIGCGLTANLVELLRDEIIDVDCIGLMLVNLFTIGDLSFQIRTCVCGQIQVEFRNVSTSGQFGSFEDVERLSHEGRVLV